MKTYKEWSVGQTFLRQLAIISVGPAIAVLARLFGGDIADGFAGGSRTNTQFGDWLLWLSSVLTWAGLVVAFVLGCRLSILKAREQKSYLLLLLTPLLIVPIMVVVFIVSTMVF